MKERILNYRKYIDDVLSGKIKTDDYEKLRNEHLIQIGFFQHERLIHLIVTVTFAILEMLALVMALTHAELSFFALALAFMVLLIPYIGHYYLLENEVQKMYRQYDEIVKHIENEK